MGNLAGVLTIPQQKLNLDEVEWALRCAADATQIATQAGRSAGCGMPQPPEPLVDHLNKEHPDASTHYPACTPTSEWCWNVLWEDKQVLALRSCHT